MRQTTSRVAIIGGLDAFERLMYPLVNVRIDELGGDFKTSVGHWRSNELGLERMEVDARVFVWELILKNFDQH